jgi:2-polyprenyl-6-hydroxyphenyl methylase/3-demethylubiquinone-9 3-methyltransferase
MGLTDREAHFEFGENWRDYAKSIDQGKIDSAIDGMHRLLPDSLAGKTFLDIGCGSGLHALAALHLGAASVMATDIDENSTSTTRETLRRFAPDARWDVQTKSVFDLPPDTFDVVYSWGVLHHTGSMWRAIEKAASLVKPGGLFVIAIYAKTPLDFAWKVEKFIYSKAPRPAQKVIRSVYTAALRARLGGSPGQLDRGMNFDNDVHDWLGGYPYETASEEEIVARCRPLGFTEVRSFVQPRSLGLFGSGCSEFVFLAG